MQIPKKSKENSPQSISVHASDPIQRLSDLATVLVHIPDHRQPGPKISPATCGEIWVREGEPILRVTRVVATIEGKESEELRYQIEGNAKF